MKIQLPPSIKNEETTSGLLYINQAVTSSSLKNKSLAALRQAIDAKDTRPYLIAINSTRGQTQAVISLFDKGHYQSSILLQFSDAANLIGAHALNREQIKKPTSLANLAEVEQLLNGEAANRMGLGCP